MKVKERKQILEYLKLPSEYTKEELEELKELLETYITRKDFACGIMWLLQLMLMLVAAIIDLYTNINFTTLVCAIYLFRFSKLISNDNPSLDNFFDMEFTRRKADLEKIRKYLKGHSGGISIEDAEKLLGAVDYMLLQYKSPLTMRSK